MREAVRRIRASRMVPRLIGVLALALLVCAVCPPARYGRGAPEIRPPLRLPLESVIRSGDGSAVWDFQTLPGDPVNGGVLAVYVVHQWAELWMDGRLVYRSEPPEGWSLTRSPGCYWILVPIGPKASQARLALRPAYPGLLPRYRPMQTDHISLLLYNVSRDWPELLLSSFCVLLGACFTVFALLLRTERQDRDRMFYLGASTAACGIWRLCDLPSLPLIFADRVWPAFPGLLALVSLLALYLIPPLFLDLVVSQEGTRPVLVLLRDAARAICLGVCVLQLLGVRDLREDLAVMTVEIAALMAVLGAVGVRDLVRPRRENAESGEAGEAGSGPLRTVFYLAFTGAGLLDMILYYVRENSLRMDLLLSVCTAHILIVGVRAVRDAVEREERILIARDYAVRARMDLLLSQIRPHFVYNALTSVYYLCDEDPEKAKEVLSDFTEYLQMDFEALAAEDLTAFREELRHARAYLAVERVRYGDGLRVVWDIGCEDFRLPALTLQPLVENAVKHGIGTTRRTETITVRTRRARDHVDLSVEDDGPGFDPAALGRPGVGGVGLRNVRERLGTLCRADVRIDSAPGRGTRVSIRIPTRVPPERGGALSPGT